MFYTIQNNGIITADNKEILTRFYDNVLPLPQDYEVGKYVVENNELVLNPNYEAEQIQKEAERIAKLSLTKREVFLGLYQARGISPDVIRQNINDPAALIEFDYASSYYRGNPLIDGVGAMLGITPEQLDEFFDEANKGNPFAWACLMPPSTEEEVEDDNTDNIA